ncbi:MAG: COX15/CtaA family protein [Planctomycetes bacterium]|nr:COX15/CtaA family protein [Planctomycetota bacterium]
MSTTPPSPRSRSLHGWSILTAVAAVPLLFLGAEVTSKGVGMVDQVGLRSPWFFLQEFMQDHGLGWLIEHGHRQVGWIVGVCVIVLVILTWRNDRRISVRLFSVGILAAVCLQGALGIFRIQLNAILGTTLALIHGSFAPIVFSLLVMMALVTSRSWEMNVAAACSPRLRIWSLIILALVFGQMVLGGLVRHMDIAFGARAHALGAFVVLGAVIWLAKLSAEEHAGAGWKLLLILVGVQILLGLESWLSKFFVETAPWNQLQPLFDRDIVRSLHYVVGAMILANSVAFALSVNRRLAWGRLPALTSNRQAGSLPYDEVTAPRLEGVA